MGTNQDWIEHYDLLTALGDYYSSGRPVYVDPEIIVADIRSKIPVRKTDNVLDAGCGTGVLTFPLAGHCGLIHGVDAGEKILAQAKRKCEQDKSAPVEFHLGNILDLPFQEGFFDHAIIYSVLQLLENDDQVRRCVKELIRVCKRGAYILLGDIPDRRVREEFDRREKTKAELKIIAEYEAKRDAYNQLREKKIGDVVPTPSGLALDTELIVAWGREYGCEGSVQRQDLRLPFSLTRRDVVLKKLFSETV